MTKTRVKIDTKNLFIPSLSPACRVADTALMLAVAAAGLAAVVAAVARQVGAL